MPGPRRRTVSPPRAARGAQRCPLPSVVAYFQQISDFGDQRKYTNTSVMAFCFINLDLCWNVRMHEFSGLFPRLSNSGNLLSQRAVVSRKLNLPHNSGLRISIRGASSGSTPDDGPAPRDAPGSHGTRAQQAECNGGLKHAKMEFFWILWLLPDFPLKWLIFVWTKKTGIHC